MTETVSGATTRKGKAAQPGRSKLKMRRITVSPIGFDYYRKNLRSYEVMAAMSGWRVPANLTSGADPQRVRGHNDVSLFFEFRDLAGLHAHLRSKGVDVSPPVKTSYGLMQVNVKDPDGYELCFTAPV